MDDAELAVAAAEAGAAVVRSRFGTAATTVDIESERAILAVLHAHRPGDAVIGEESGRSGPSVTARTWLVDPLCGTVNFHAGTGPAGVNVALSNGEVTAAAVTDPFTGETWWTDGTVAFGRPGPPIPSARSRLVDLNLDPPFPNSPAFRTVALAADPEFALAFRTRVVSTSLALAWVASGRRAGYVTDGDLHGSVHFAAPIALCRAAGCTLTNLVGGPVHTGVGGLVAAADPVTHAHLIDLIARRAETAPLTAPPPGTASG